MRLQRFLYELNHPNQIQQVFLGPLKHTNHLWPKSKLEGREGEKNRSQKIRLNLRQLMDCLSHIAYLVDKISGFENN